MVGLRRKTRRTIICSLSDVPTVHCIVVYMFILKCPPTMHSFFFYMFILRCPNRALDAHSQMPQPCVICSSSEVPTVRFFFYMLILPTVRILFFCMFILRYPKCAFICLLRLHSSISLPCTAAGSPRFSGSGPSDTYWIKSLTGGGAEEAPGNKSLTAPGTKSVTGNLQMNML